MRSGTNLAFMGSNDAYWNMQYEDGGQTIFTYKSMYDPNPDVTTKTAMFREIGRPECLLIGVQHADIRALDSSSRLCGDCRAACASDPWLQGSLRRGDRGRRRTRARHADGLSGLHSPGARQCSSSGTAAEFDLEWRCHPPLRFERRTESVNASGGRNLRGLSSPGGGGRIIARVYSSPLCWDRSAPVDPRVQQFMRNALDDLTRPAAPAAVRGRPTRASRRSHLHRKPSIPASSDASSTAVATGVPRVKVRKSRGTVRRSARDGQPRT